MTRLAINDLMPGTPYAIQVRANDGDAVSEWSRVFNVTTIIDTTLPAVPANVTWVSTGDSFHGEWDAVTTNTNGGVCAVTRYQLELVAGATTKVVSVPQKTDGTKVTFDLPFETNRALFGTPQPTVKLRVAAVDTYNLASAYSTQLTASNPVPSPPTAAVVTESIDSVGLSWTPPSDVDLIGYHIYVGATSGFTPSSGNLVFSGDATNFTYNSTTYSLQWFKIRAVDKFGQESTDLTTSGTPKSPFVVDSTAPNVPSITSATLTLNSAATEALCTVVWSLSSPPSDLGGFQIRYRKTGDTNWSQINATKDDTTVVIFGLVPYVNYDVQMRSYDFMANYSAWSATTTATANTNTAPATPTGLASTPGKESIQYTWTANSEADLAKYEVTFSTSATFASGNTTFFTAPSTPSLTVSGLAANTTYYMRVRAVDSGGLTSSFTSTNTTATTTYPAATSDGFAPQSSPTPTALSGLGYVFLSWAPVTLNSNGTAQVDPVTYEVHVGTTSGFTTSGATKAFEASDTFAVVEKDGSGTPLAYGTSYFFKLIAKDRDGSAAVGSASAGTPPGKVAATDSNLVAADVGAYSTSQSDTLLNGKNKVTWSSSDPGTAANLAGDVWFTMSSGLVSKQWQGTGGTSWTQITLTDTVLASIAAGKITSGTVSAQTIQIASTGSVQSTDYVAGSAGWKLSTAGLEIRSGTVAANTIISGTGIVNNLVVASGGAIQSSTYVAGTTGFKISNTGIELNDANSKVYAAALQGGTISATSSIILGPSANLIVNGGYIRSNTYSAGVSGFNIGTSGIELNDSNSKVSVAAIQTGSLSTQTITLTGSSSIVAGTWSLTPSGLSIPNGGISAASLNIQTGENIISPKWADFEYYPVLYPVSASWPADNNASLTVTVDTTTKKFNGSSMKVVNAAGASRTVYLGDTTTDYNTALEPSTRYLVSAYFSNAGSAVNATAVIKQSDGTTASGSAVSITTSAAFTRYTWVITTTAGITGGLVGITFAANGTFYVDGVQVEPAINSTVTTPSQWAPPSNTRIDGGQIRTGAIRSTAIAQVWDDTNQVYTNSPTSQPAWSIDTAGAATLGNLQVRGSVIVGALGEANTALSQISSPNYVPGVGGTGWAIRSDGYAEFRNLASNIIGADQLTSDAIQTSKIGSGSLSAEIQLTGSLFAYGKYGERVGLNAGGFLVQGPKTLTYNVTNKALTTNVATLTIGTHTIVDNDYVKISGVDSTFDGEYIVTSHTSTTISYVLVAADVTSTSATGTAVSVNHDANVPGPTYVQFPSDGSQPNILAGQVQATTLTISQGMTVTGSSLYEAGANMVLANGVQPPKQPPTLTLNYFMSTNASNAVGKVLGLTWDGTQFVGVDNTLPDRSTVYFANLNKFKADGVGSTRTALTWSDSVRRYAFSVAYFSAISRYVVLCRDVTATNDTAGWMLSLFDSSGTNTGNLAIPTSYKFGFDGTPVVGVDHTNGRALVAYFDPTNSPGQQAIRDFTLTSTTITFNTEYLEQFENGAQEYVFVARGTFDLGGDRFILMHKDSGGGSGTNLNVKSYTVSGTTLSVKANEAFPVRASNPTGMCWDGSKFWGIHSQQSTNTFVNNGTITLTRYEGGQYFWTSATQSSTWWIGATWYTNLNGSRNIATKALTSNVATLTTSTNHGIQVGDSVVVAGVDATFNGTFTVTAVTSNTFSYAKTASNVTAVSATGTVKEATARETILSPSSSITMVKRARLQATMPTIPPGDSGLNAPTSVRFYQGKATTDPGTGKLFWQQVDRPSDNSAPTALFDGSVTPSGAPQTGTAAYPNVTNPGQIQSADGQSYWKGDNTAQFAQLVLVSTVDAATSAGNKPALRIGDIAGLHLRVDGNEILAMSNDTTVGTLYLQAGGGAVKAVGLIQTGVNTVNVTAINTNIQKVITFATAFPSVPNVTVSPVVTSPQTVSSSVSSISTTGFTYNVNRSSGTGNMDFCWIASTG